MRFFAEKNFIEKNLQELQVEQSRRFTVSRLKIFFTLAGGSLLLSGMSGINWGMSYTQERVVPQVAALLSDSLNRPVQLGQIERITPTGLRIGASVIPATATDADTVTAEAIEVEFNPMNALSQRELSLTITLIRPHIFVAQTLDGKWLGTEIDLGGDSAVELTRIRLQDATIELVAIPKRLKLLHTPEAKGMVIAPDRVTFDHINTDISIAETEQTITFDLTGQAQLGGNFHFRGNFNWETDRTEVAVKTDRLALIAISPLLPPTVRCDQGELSSNIQAQIAADAAIDLQGHAELQNLALQVESEPNLFTQTSGEFYLQKQQITVANAETKYGQIPFETIAGTIDLEQGLNLTGRVRSVNVAAFLSTFELDVPFAVGGSLATTELRVTGPLDGAIYSGSLVAAQPVQFDRLKMAEVQGNFTYDSGSDRLNIPQLKFIPEVGGMIAASADIVLGEADKGESDLVKAQVQTQNISADAVAQLYQAGLPALNLGRFNSSAEIFVANEVPQVKLDWQLSQGNYPAEGKIILDDETGQLQDTSIQIADSKIQVAGELNQGKWQMSAEGDAIPVSQFIPDQTGMIAANVQLTGQTDRPIESITGSGNILAQIGDGTLEASTHINQAQWQAAIQSKAIPLSSFSSDLPGILTGAMNLKGDLADPRPETIEATGEVQLSEGISHQITLLNQPLDAEFDWNGEKLNIVHATTAGLDLQGWIAAKFPQGFPPAVSEMNLTVNMQDYDLATLPIAASLPLPIQGLADFAGQVTGNPNTPQVQGRLQLQNLAVAQFAFEPTLSGNVNFAPSRGLNLNLRGEQDQIELVVDDRYRPTQVSLQVGDMIAQTSAVEAINPDSYRYRTQIRNFPLEKLNLAPVAGLGVVGGQLSAQLDLDLTNLTNPAVNGEIAINRPSIGSHTVPLPDHAHDRFTGKIQYIDRVLTLNQAELKLGTGRYHLTGSFQQNTRQTIGQNTVQAPQFSAQLSTDSGNLKDFVTLLSPTQWQALIQTWEMPIALQPTAFTDASSSSPIALSIPDLTQLQGNFSTEITLQGSQQSGISAQFNLQGQNWQMGQYGIRQIRLNQGNFSNNHLTVSPLQLQGLMYQMPDRSMREVEAIVSFAGKVGEQSEGQIAIENIPLTVLGQIANIPIPLSGHLGGAATLSGNITNPEMTGSVAMQNAQLNQRQFKDLELLFDYSRGQFNIQDWVLRDP